jgi:hypothetical protein
MSNFNPRRMQKCISVFIASIKIKINYTCIDLRTKSRILVKLALTMDYLQMY